MTIEDAKRQIERSLAPYRERHPRADVQVRTRTDIGAIRVRVIDPDFAGVDRVAREPEVWGLLQGLPDEVFSVITMLLLVTPSEAESSLSNLEFDQSSRSMR